LLTLHADVQIESRGFEHDTDWNGDKDWQSLKVDAIGNAWNGMRNIFINKNEKVETTV